MSWDIYLRGLLLGMKPTKIELMPFGFSISFKLRPKDYNKKIAKGNLLELKKIIVAISGPLINLVLILFFIQIDIDIIPKDIAVYANILILLFNLLPIYPLDGGRILKSIIHIIFGGKIAKIITNKVANVTMLIITIIGSIAVFYFKNIAIFIIIMFLWWIVIRENKKYKLIINAYNIVSQN